MDRFAWQVCAKSARDWEAALEALEPVRAPAFQQGAVYGAIAEAAGRRVARLELRSSGRQTGLVQMIGQAGLWLISRGPVFAPDLTAVQQRAALRALAQRVGVVLATPELPVAGAGLIPLVTSRHQAIWDLSLGPEALRAGLAGKWRNRLSAAERASLVLCPETDLAGVLEQDRAQQRARGYRALPPGFTRNWSRIAPQDLMALRVETPAGQRIAAGIFLIHGAGASYHIGWSADAGRAGSAHNLMLWQAALRLRARGARQLDLGAVDGEEGAGRMRFKLGTGARAERLGQTCWVLPG
ncbi:MAG: GNAT family N-acetyltransferase [Rhodobacteraceae bacterium]|nr:MAG: GNAT family N-acetyltransferase [Paracoccaceae bacterium]